MTSVYREEEKKKKFRQFFFSLFPFSVIVKLWKVECRLFFISLEWLAATYFDSLTGTGNLFLSLFPLSIYSFCACKYE